MTSNAFSRVTFQSTPNHLARKLGPWVFGSLGPSLPRAIFRRVKELLVALVGALLATNQPAAVSNLVEKTTGAKIEITDPNDPVEQAFQKVMDEDDAAHAEVDKWLTDNQAFAAKGAGQSEAELNKRIDARFELVRQGYEGFLATHTNHARAHLAYAGFLEEIQREDEAVAHMQKSRDLDPKNPAVWNNLANYHGHRGPVKLSFEYYAKAIELNPREPIYYHNFGTTVYLFRPDAREYYHIDEQQVFNKALELYSNALWLDPTNFPLASDVAQTYYGIRPLRVDAALKAWTNALALAHDSVEREGVYVHFARLNWMAGRTNLSLTHLNNITNTMYGDLKDRLRRNLDRVYFDPLYRTNEPPATTEKPTP